MIPKADRITYAEARHVTGRSHGYLYKLVQEGRLSREGGARGQSWSTFLSRPEVEALAIAESRPHLRTDYWMTVSEAAEALGTTPHLVRTRRPTFRPGKRWLVVRAQDVVRAQFGLDLRGR